ncbi:dUTP diphosphatase [Pseudobacillus badius]|uniref:dUTP diphosphatase n=1 Tax=Bacillus badius TaxID=1455 RepID=UPI0024A1942C|nr:dUTP diphosphatase [Bacillus badius]GLY11386.1 hypothetical protein Bbad01_26020 [Bacillus badius]
MNLTKLFEMQKVLDERIMDEHPELRGQNNLDWKVLALQVELGECANEWRGFKKWSKNQKPNIVSVQLKDAFKGRKVVQGFRQGGTRRLIIDDVEVPFSEIDEYYDIKNPLLEEYVDCLHFILSIGLELKAEKLVVWSVQESESIIDMFNRVFMQISVIQSCIESRATIMQTHYSILVDLFVELGEMLGFTWEQIEEAYMNKNAVNHARQENGY